MGSCRTIQISSLPVLQDTGELIEMLENITGYGTVHACKLRPPRSGKSRMNAYVQFETRDLAGVVQLLAFSGHLRFGLAKLKVQFMERDIIAKPKSIPTLIENEKLYMGNLISENRFSFLWSTDSSVVIAFGFDIRKLTIYLNHDYNDYKMQLAFRDIRYMHLHSLRRSKLLLVQLLSAPKIYYKEESSTSYDMNDGLEYYKDSSETQWIRTTDFTESFSIGQSSSLCFEFPLCSDISKIRENFAHYKEIEEQLLVEPGTPFSDARLVPIINPPPELHVPFEILFQVNSLVQSGMLSGPSLGMEFFKLLHPKYVLLAYRNHALEKLSNLKSTCYDPVKLIKKEYSNLKDLRRRPLSFDISLDDGLMHVHRVQITPSRVYFWGPEINVSNRVTRHYAEYINDFLRVSFVDENWNRLYATDMSHRVQGGLEIHTKLYERVLSVLEEGIVIGNKKFEFLAFSTSQLRESSVWMFASNGRVSAESIRNWMGDFLAIRNVAKCASRMGQAFSSSTETLHVSKHEIEDIPDIYTWQEHERHTFIDGFGKISWQERKQYTFSDGIGKISLSLAKQVADKCKCNYIPSAFQIRIGGYKGVVAIDPASLHKLSLRPSMKKYESENTNLDVLSWTKFRPCYLNRQIITLLSTLGVKDQNFERMQEQEVKTLDNVLTTRDLALEVLQIMTVGDSHNAIISMLSAGYLPKSEPYVSMILRAFRASKLLELRCKAHIFVPEGRCLMGCLDESRTLNYGEVFVQVSHTGKDRTWLSAFGRSPPNHSTTIIEGKVVVAKNPCLHPGDIQVLSAVNIPELHHMVDCIVFPQQGKRPHPDECSGSDLDGDLYFVSWDTFLIPPQQDEPMDYTASPAEHLDHEVTIQEIQEYFANYMLNDTLGIIANRHTVYADQDVDMARSENCVTLAKLFSVAVDFPKTGIPAEIPSSLIPKEYPDFMEKEDKPMYESQRVIGKLYRAIKKLTTESLSINAFTRDVAEKTYDKALEVDGFEMYCNEALKYKSWYDSKLATLMYHYGIMYEAEIVSGNIFSLSKFYGSKLGDLKETIMIEVKTLRKEVRSWFDDVESSGGDNEHAKASAWYHVTYHPDYWGQGDFEGKDTNNPHFISFPWVVYDKLLRIKRNKIGKH